MIVKDLPVANYTLSDEIYTLTEQQSDDGTWYCINGDTSYNADSWTLKEAIDDYLSDESKESRLDSFYRSNGFYD